MKMDSGVRKWDERMKSFMSQKQQMEAQMKAASKGRESFQLPAELGLELRKSSERHGMTIMGFHAKVVKLGMQLLNSQLDGVMETATRIVDQASGNTGPAKK